MLLRAFLLWFYLVRHKTWAQEETTTVEITPEPDLTSYRDGYNITKAEVVKLCDIEKVPQPRHLFIDLCLEGLCGWKYDSVACSSILYNIKKPEAKFKKMEPLMRNVAFLLWFYLVRHKTWAQEETTTVGKLAEITPEPDLTSYRDGYNITKAEVVKLCDIEKVPQPRHLFIDLCLEGLCGWKYDSVACSSILYNIKKPEAKFKKMEPLMRNLRTDLIHAIGLCAGSDHLDCGHLLSDDNPMFYCGNLMHYDSQLLKRLGKADLEWSELSLIYASIAFAKKYFAGPPCDRFQDPGKQRLYTKHDLCVDKLDKRPACQFVPAVVSLACNANVTCIGEDPLLASVFAADSDADKSEDQEERIAEGVAIMARYCFNDYRVNPFRRDINEAVCTTLFTKYSNSLAPFYTKKCQGDADVEPIIRAFCVTISNYAQQKNSTFWISICRNVFCILCSVVTILHIAYHCFDLHRSEEIPSPFGDDLMEQHERSFSINTVDKIDLIYVHVPVNVEKFEMNFRTLNKDPTKVAHLRTDFTTNTCSFFKPEFAVTTKERAQLPLSPLKKNRIYCVARVIGRSSVGIFPEGDLLHIMEKNAYTCFTHVGAPAASIEQIIAMEMCVKSRFEVSCLRLGEFFFFAMVGGKQDAKSVTLRLECRVDSLESKKQTLFQFGADKEGTVSMGCGTSPRKVVPMIVDWAAVTIVILRRQRKTIKVYVGPPGQPSPVLQFGIPDTLLLVEQLETIVSMDPEGVNLFFPDFALRQSPIKGF